MKEVNISFYTQAAPVYSLVKKLGHPDTLFEVMGGLTRKVAVQTGVDVFKVPKKSSRHSVERLADALRIEFGNLLMGAFFTSLRKYGIPSYSLVELN